MNKTKGVEAKILLSKDFCELEAVKYIAFRYGTTPEQVLEHYFMQSGIIPSAGHRDADYTLTPNEMALFHDLGIRPMTVVAGNPARIIKKIQE